MWSPVSSECKGVFCHWELNLPYRILYRTRQYWGWERWSCVNLCTPLTSSCALRFYEGGTQRHELRADMEGMNVSASIPYHSCVTCQYYWTVLSVELLYLHHRWIVMTYRRTELISRIPFFSPIVYTLRKGTSTIGLDNTNKSSGLWVYLRLQRIHGDRASQWRRAWWWCRLKELSIENDANENFSSDPSPLASDCFIVSVLHDDGLMYFGALDVEISSNLAYIG